MKLGLIGILGKEMEEDFWGTVTRVRDLGYQGIEAVDAHLLKGDVAENRARFEALGLEQLTVSADQTALRERLHEVRDRALETGAKRVSVWWSVANDRDILLAEAELYNQAGRTLKEDGIRLCYHNHDQEFRNTFDGVYVLDVLAANTDPEAVYFTIDVGWVAVGGEDPARVIRRLKGRVPVIHIKDFADLSDRASFTSVGTGVVDFKSALAAAVDSGVEWAIVEQDQLRRLTAWESVTMGALYLRELGVGSA